MSGSWKICDFRVRIASNDPHPFNHNWHKSSAHILCCGFYFTFEFRFFTVCHMKCPKNACSFHSIIWVWSEPLFFICAPITSFEVRFSLQSNHSTRTKSCYYIVYVQCKFIRKLSHSPRERYSLVIRSKFGCHSQDNHHCWHCSLSVIWWTLFVLLPVFC